MKKIVKVFMCLVLALTLTGGSLAILGGCAPKKPHDFTIVCFNGGRGTQFMTNLIEEFKKTYDGEIKLITGNKDQVQTDLNKMVNSDNAPDLVFCDQDQFPSTFIGTNQLENLDGLLNENVTGETVKIKDKLVGGILESFSTKPYGDGKVYTLPLFYSPTGMFFNADKFYDNDGNGTYDGKNTAGKYELPRTWGEFFALGDTLTGTANATPANPYLFTLPTTGYLDGMFGPVIAEYAGFEKLNKVMAFAEGIYDDAQVKEGLSVIGRLLETGNKYIDASMQSNVTTAGVGFIKNQQNIIDGNVLFIPNGDWLIAEMAETTPANFNWGFMALPAKDKDSKSVMNTFIERMYIPKNGAKKDVAKDFVKLIYSDKGAEIIAKANGAIIPTKPALEKAESWGVPAATLKFFKEFDNADSVITQFAATDPVPDHSWGNTMKDQYPSLLVEGTKFTADWIAELKKENDIFRAARI